MTGGLKRFHESRQSHFLTFSCSGRRPNFSAPPIYDLFLNRLEETRYRFDMRIYAYVIMPEHVHLLVSESDKETLANAMHFLKLSFTKTLGYKGSFWEKRYYDRNIRDANEFDEKLGYIHRNPVKRGLCLRPEDWPWSSFCAWALGEIHIVEVESEMAAARRETRLREAAFSRQPCGDV